MNDTSDGFQIFSLPHIIILCAAALTVTGLTAAARRQAGRGRTPSCLILTLSVILPASEILQDIYLHFIMHETILYNLPLHLCGLGIFTNLAGTWLFRFRKLSGFINEVSLMLIAPGALSALLFPDWTDMPILSYMSLQGFFSHTLLVTIPLMMAASECVHPRFSHIWYHPAFLLIVSIPIWIFDCHFKCNYMFLRHGVPGTPLQWIENAAAPLGHSGYILLLLLTVMVIITAEYGIITAVSRIRKNKRLP